MDNRPTEILLEVLQFKSPFEEIVSPEQILNSKPEGIYNVIRCKASSATRALVKCNMGSRLVGGEVKIGDNSSNSGFHSLGSLTKAGFINVAVYFPGNDLIYTILSPLPSTLQLACSKEYSTILQARTTNGRIDASPLLARDVLSPAFRATARADKVTDIAIFVEVDGHVDPNNTNTNKATYVHIPNAHDAGPTNWMPMHLMTNSSIRVWGDNAGANQTELGITITPL